MFRVQYYNVVCIRLSADSSRDCCTCLYYYDGALRGMIVCLDVTCVALVHMAGEQQINAALFDCFECEVCSANELHSMCCVGRRDKLVMCDEYFYQRHFYITHFIFDELNLVD